MIRSLAVLPLENVSHDPAQEYFVDGMTEAQISDRSRLKDLRVISRTSAMRYKGVHKALPDIARELNVDVVLEGSALLLGKRVRISIQLVSARRDETLWSERYDRDLEDVLDLQSEVAAKVAGEIALRITPREAKRLAKRQSVNPDAHIEYLKGEHISAATSPQAIELNPGLTSAHAVLGRITYCTERHAEARATMLKALSLDPLSMIIHTTVGDAYYYAREYEKSVTYYRKAIELDPRFDGAHTELARSLEALGKFEEAPA